MNYFIMPILWKITIGAVLLFFLALILKVVFLKLTGKSVKGTFSKSESINRTIKGSGLIKKDNPKGFIFGFFKKNKVWLPNDKEGHITVFGGSGIGKTSAVLIPSLRAWDSPFFAIDISGDISDKVITQDQDKVMLEPENPDRSYTYNVFYLIDKATNEGEKRAMLEQLVMLIVDIPESTNDVNRYFLETARKIFLAGMLAFYDIGLDFTDICKTIFFSSMDKLIELIGATGNELALGYIKPLAGENEKNISGAKSALNNKIKLFADNANMERVLCRGSGSKNFNPEMLETKKVFLKVSDKKQEYHAAYMHIIVAQILEYILSRKFKPGKDKRILIALDEFASLGYFDVLAPFRKSRKNGCNLCILTQSLADLDLVYSEKERKVILDNCKYIAVLGATENSTREYFSNLIGKEDIQKKSKSSGKGGSSTSVSIQKEYAINPEEWKELGENLIVIHPAGFVKLKKNYYYKDKGYEEKRR